MMEFGTRRRPCEAFDKLRLSGGGSHGTLPEKTGFSANDPNSDRFATAHYCLPTRSISLNVMNILERGKAVVTQLSPRDNRAFWAEFRKRKSVGDSVDRQVIADIFSRYPELTSDDEVCAVAYGSYADR